MKNQTEIDLSHEVDYMTMDVQDMKLVSGMKVDLCECKFLPNFNLASIMTDLDEIVSVRVQNDQQQDMISWILTQKCKIYPAGMYKQTHRYKDMLRIAEVIQKRAEIEAAERQKQEQEKMAERAAQGYKNLGSQGGYYQHKVSDDDDDEDDDDGDEYEYTGVQGAAAGHRDGGNAADDLRFDDNEVNDANSQADSTDQNFDVDMNNEDIEEDFHYG